MATQIIPKDDTTWADVTTSQDGEDATSAILNRGSTSLREEVNQLWRYLFNGQTTDVADVVISIENGLNIDGGTY